MSCPRIWNMEKEKNREKEKVGDTLTKLNEEKRQQRARAREKKQRRLFFCWKKAT